MRTKTLWIKDEYLQLILEGRKTVEVRVAYSNLVQLEAGDRLLLNGKYPYVITRVERYANFDELLAHEDPAAIAPGTPRAELPRLLREIYPPDKEALGVLAFKLKKEVV